MTDPRQQAAIERARTELPKDDRVLGVYLIGSHATGENDAYSDVDVHIVVTDESIEEFHTDYTRVLETLAGPLVLAEPIPGVPGWLGLSEDWLHIDLIAHPVSAYDPEQYEGVLPLFDRTGDLLPPARRPAPEHGEPYFPIENVNLFFYFLGNLVTVLGRSEHVVANSGIVVVRDQLVRLMRAERGVRRTGGAKRLNAYLSEEQRAFLESIPAAGCDPKDIIAANQVICAEFIRRGRALAERTGAVWPDAFEAATLRHLREHFGVEFGPYG